MKEYALIVAGGKGTRIKSAVPKQFIELAGKPILLHTLEAFLRYSPDIVLALVLPQEEFPTWDKIRQHYHFDYPVLLQPGGTTRFQSVKNGLQILSGEGLVAIHDGVRPLVSEDLIAEGFRLAVTHRCAVASVRLNESLRVADQENNSHSVDRSKYRLIQTPQTFDLQLIKKAYEQQEDTGLTDDASVAEKAGHTISLYEGSFTNLKITTPEDLVVAGALLARRKALN
jgi:2-C-methyl-D-erythritol 4-phosphate cytidylyltransferase